jgi:hypothetical protein
MTTISDLPTVAIKRITQLARGRIIHGCNGYAVVSRQWRDAGDSSSSSQESEQLQLFLDLADMSEAAINRALDWLARHGKQAGVLVIASGLPPSVAPDSMYTSVAALSYLRRLELMQQHSLVRLAPVLDQLPQLQHLEAHVSMVCDLEGWDSTDEHAVSQGVFADEAGQYWDDLPDLQQQLCPQLTHLRLLIEPNVYSLWLDEQLPLLLPARLKQLELLGVQDSVYSWLQPRLLSHLTGLQQLTLQRVFIPEEDFIPGGMEALEGHLAGVQQVVLNYPGGTFAGIETLELLAPKVISFSTPFFMPDEETITRLVCLTRLELKGALQHPPVAALAALKLQELVVMDFGDSDLVTMVQLAGDMPTLRSLRLQGTVGSSLFQEQLSAALEQCTQLTSLHLAVTLPFTYATTLPFMGVPQQLVGLRRLTVPAELLEQEVGAWLAPLTALTRLCLDMPSHMLHFAGGTPGGAESQGLPMQAQVQGVLQQVQAWPASLQQVVMWVSSDRMGVKRMCCEYIPAVPAGGRFSVWVEQREGKAAGWARPLRPCPHLPGVWELQGEVEGRPC